MIVRPAPDDRVELGYQHVLLHCLVLFDCRPDFSRMRLHVFLGGFDAKFSAIFAQGPSEEVEPVVDMHDPGLLGGQGKTPVLQEGFDQRSRFFQHVPGRAGRYKIIGITYEIDFAF